MNPWELIVSLIIFGIPVALIVVLFRLIMRNKRENIKLRLEVGKLADELEQMRKQRDTEKGDSSTDSG